MIISADLLRRAGVSAATAATWSAPLTAACQAPQITTSQRVAGFLANILHETGNLSDLAESLDYSAASLLTQWPAHFGPSDVQAMARTASHPADQRAIAERVYGGRYGNRAEGSGDGWLYRGHGGMQTTFYANYLALAHVIAWGRGIKLLPDYLTTPEGASVSAAVFWARAGCNAMMDAGQIVRARTVCNGGGIGMANVQARYTGLLRVLGVAPAGQPHSTADDDAAVEALNVAALARATS